MAGQSAAGASQAQKADHHLRRRCLPLGGR
jgi:hypothetical protein